MDTMPAGSVATELLLAAAASPGAASWLVPGGEAALASGIALAHPDSVVVWQPIDSRERDAVAAFPAKVAIEEPGAIGSPVAAVVLAPPQERSLARRWLLAARDRLLPGGHLIVAGANDAGIKSILADASRIFGAPATQSYRSKHRLATFRKDEWLPEPDWALTPGIAPGTWEEFALDVHGVPVPLVTQAGVFAGAKIDPGTRLLLDVLPERIAGSVLDVGCGAGVIGVAAALAGAHQVTMSDVNLLAVQAASENVRRLDLIDVVVVASDAYQHLDARRYDLIVSNPPFHRGKAVDLSVADDLIAGSPEHLEPGGSLLIVANAFLAYGRRMERVFRQVETVRATRQYHVLRGASPA